jgi:hypothetical protein
LQLSQRATKLGASGAHQSDSNVSPRKKHDICDTARITKPGSPLNRSIISPSRLSGLASSEARHSAIDDVFAKRDNRFAG